LRNCFSLKVAFAVALTGCASGGVTPIGGASFRALPEDAPVAIYSAEKDIPRPFKVVGLLSYTNPGKYRILSLSDVIPDIKAEARKAGANGVIIDETHPVKSGVVSTGIGVTGRAVIVDPPSI
jgi:hypothetical protein